MSLAANDVKAFYVCRFVFGVYWPFREKELTMTIERVGYRRLYDAIDCSISGCDEIQVAFPFEDRFHVEIYMGPTPRFGICTEKNDDYYAHPGTETNKNIEYHFDVTQSSHPRRFFIEISCFRDIEVSTALSQAFHRQDPRVRDEILSFAEKDGKEYRCIADLISGTIGLKFHRQFVMELLNENFVALRDTGFAISVIGTPVELLDDVQMSTREIQRIKQFASLLPHENVSQWNGAILGWLMKAWSEQDPVSKFNALFTTLEMLLKGVKGEISQEKQRHAETLRQLIVKHSESDEKQEELLAFLDTIVTNQNPSVMSRFVTLAEQADMPTREADIEALRHYKQMRDGLIHRGNNNIQLVVPHPQIGDKESHAFEDIVERYVSYVLFGDLEIYQSYWRKPLQPKWFRPKLTVSS
jgi:hypothetical protein